MFFDTKPETKVKWMNATALSQCLKNTKKCLILKQNSYIRSERSCHKGSKMWLLIFGGKIQMYRKVVKWDFLSAFQTLFDFANLVIVFVKNNCKKANEP